MAQHIFTSADTLETILLTDIQPDITELYADDVTHAADTTTHGATGAVVGTTNEQTLTNKTLTTPSIDAITLTGGQIAFPDDALPSADPNTLDDYEEGTVDVDFTCGTSGTITIDESLKTLEYIKTGRSITLAGRLKVTSVSSPVGRLTLTSLPFTASSTQGFPTPWTQTLESTAANLRVGIAGTTIYIDDFLNGAIELTVAVDIKANSEFYMGGTYIAV